MQLIASHHTCNALELSRQSTLQSTLASLEATYKHTRIRYDKYMHRSQWHVLIVKTNRAENILLTPQTLGTESFLQSCQILSIHFTQWRYVFWRQPKINWTNIITTYIIQYIGFITQHCCNITNLVVFCGCYLNAADAVYYKHKSIQFQGYKYTQLGFPHVYVWGI